MRTLSSIMSIPSQPFQQQELTERLKHLDAGALLKLKKSLQSQSQLVAAPVMAEALSSSGEDAGCYEMSRIQRRFWLQSQFGEAGSASYNIAAAFWYPIRLSSERLEIAWRTLLDRHEILRTGFLSADNGQRFCQRPRASRDWRMSFEQLTGVTEEEVLACLGTAANREAARPFDLAKDWLLRVVWFESPQRDGCGLSVVFHHSICDGQTLRILCQELAVLYEGKTSLPAPAHQYRDFVAWEQRREAEDSDGDLKYWTDVFAELPEPLPLNTDFPRQAVAQFSGSVVEATFEAATVGRFVHRCTANSGTLFMGCVAVTQILLARWSRYADVVIGIPSSGRIVPSLENLVGPLVNTLALRLNFNDLELNFDDFFARVRNVVLDGFAHQGCSFDRLVEAVKAKPLAGHSPLFDILLGLVDEEDEALVLGGQYPRLLPLATPYSKVDISFLLTRKRDGGLTLRLEYDKQLFSSARMARLLCSWQTLFLALAAQSSEAIGRLPLLDEAGRRQVLQAFNQTTRPYPENSTITAEFRRQCERTPDLPALQAGKTTLTYRELDALSERLAVWLYGQARVQPDRPLGLMADRSADMLVAILAILKTGAAYMPLSPDLPLERLRFMLDDADVGFVLGETRCAPLFADWGGRFCGMAEVMERLPAECCPAPMVPQSASSLAIVIYTSGSTGQPKGTLVEHRGVLRTVCNTDYHQVVSGERVLQTGALSFDASTFDIWGPLLNGGCCCLPPGKELLEIQEFAELLDFYRVDTAFITTGLFNQIVEYNVSALSRLGTILTGGEKVSVRHMNRLRQAAPHLRIMHMYGPTENTTFSTWHEVKGAYTDTVPIGAPIANSTAYILDNFLQPLPIGVPGEIYCGGPGVTRGYLGHPELTAERFLPDPYDPACRAGAMLYKTGDLACWDEHGQIVFLGRNDDQVKIRGFRIELGEVELLLRRLPEVENAVVTARRSGGTSELVAYIVPAAGTSPSREAIRAGMAALAPSYFLPSFIVFMEQLPLNASGKVNRRRLPEPGEQESTGETATEGNGQACQGRAETIIGEICQQLLNRPHLSRSDNFFRLGGDSIKAIQLMSRARQRGLIFKLADVFAADSIAELAAGAQELTTAGESEGRRPLLMTSPLSPIQRWWVSQRGMPIDHFNLSGVWKIPGERLCPERLKIALDQLLVSHPSLRLSYLAGGGRQSIHSEATYSLETLVLSASEGGDRSDAIRGFYARLQASLCLARGHLLAAGLILDGQDSTLALILHHWVADELTGRILIDDLEHFYYSDADIAEAIPEPIPFTNWCEAVAGTACRDFLRHDLVLWDRLASEISAFSLPKPPEKAVSTTATGTLAAATTDGLVARGKQLYQADLRELLLAAFSRAWQSLTGQSYCAVALEGHGRETLPGYEDIGRTAGWFTALFPFSLDTLSGESWGDLCRRHKDRLRALPRHDFGYLATGHSDLPPISFNYLGQTDSASTSRWQLAAETAGENHQEGMPPLFTFDVIAQMFNGQLAATVAGYSLDCSSGHIVTPERLLEAWLGELSELAEWLTSPTRVPQLSLADLTIQDLSLIQLDALLAKHGWGTSDVQDILPLTSLQAGIVYHTVASGDRQSYADQVSLRLRGVQLAAAVLARAIDTLGEIAEGLRIAIITEDVPAPLQVVLKNRRPACEVIDLSSSKTGEAGESQEAFLEALRLRNRQRGFDLRGDSLLRFTIVTLAADTFELVIDFHHVAIDGWSSTLILSMLEKIVKEPESVPVVPSLSAYYRWWQRETANQAESVQYWERLVGDYCQRILPPGQPGTRDGAASEPLFWETILESAVVEPLRTWAATANCTLSHVFQALWGLLLSVTSGSDDIAFGCTDSGRNVPVPGIEGLVGMVIHTLPVRLRLQRGMTFAELGREVRTQFTDSQSHSHVSLADIQALSPAGASLLTHTIVFENAPDETAEDGKSGWQWETTAIHDPMHFDFGLLVVPQNGGLKLRYVVNGHLYHQSDLQAITEELIRLATLAGADPECLLPSLKQTAQIRKALPWTVSATFTADPLVEMLQYWGSLTGLPPAVALTGFNQILPELTLPDSRLNDFPEANHLLLWRLADWPQTEWEAASRLLVEAICSFQARQPLARIMLVPCPADDESGLAKCSAYAAGFTALLPVSLGVTVVDLADLDQAFQLQDWYLADTPGGLPYTEEFFAALAARLARLADGRTRQPPVKVFAVDADNTLWGGVVGEDGASGIRLEAGHLDLQNRLIAADAAGQLVCLVSKNNPGTVAEALTLRQDMPLRPSHFLRLYEGWQPKSESLRRLAADLNLGLDAVVFLDDSPFECAEVRQHCPTVRVVQLPDTHRVEFYRHLWLFDHEVGTAEDKQRAAMYRQEAARQSYLEQTASSPSCFFAQLQIAVTVLPPGVEDLSRLTQLTRRTNQFNTTTLRLQDSEMASRYQPSGVTEAEGMPAVLAVRVRDRFGDYGLTGAVFGEKRGDAWLVTHFLLSCRVLGRGVEFEVIRQLARMAQAAGFVTLDFAFTPSGKNAPAKAFLDKVAGHPPYSLTIANALKLSLETVLEQSERDEQTGTTIPATGAAAVAPVSSVVASTGPRSPSSLDYAWLAGNLARGGDIVKRLRGQYGRGRHSGRIGRGGPPQGEVETELARMWSEILRIASPGRDDVFADLGGHSLKAVMLLGRLQLAFHKQFTLDDLQSHPTIRSLAGLLRTASAGTAVVPPLVSLPSQSSYPLSRGQERLWLLESLRGDGPSPFLLTIAVAFPARLGVAVLRQAFSRLLERHESLRTSIRLDSDGRPRQYICAASEVELPLTVLTAGGPRTDSAFLDLLGKLGGQPFDLAQPPLLRIFVWQDDDEAGGIPATAAGAGGPCYLGIVTHHIVSDGWSLGVMGDELQQLYGEALAGLPARLAPLAVQYRDYAVWQSECLHSVSGQAGRDFWLKYLDELPEPLNLPADYPRPPVKQTAGAAQTFILPAQPWAEMQRMASNAGGQTAFCALLSAVQLLLCRLAGQNEFLVGTPVAARPHPQLENQIGFFVNLLPLRAVVNLEASPSDFLRATGENLRCCLDHQDYSFDYLVDDLRLARELSRAPLFDVLVAFQNVAQNAVCLGGEPGRTLDFPSLSSQYDLTFNAFDLEDGQLKIVLEYDTALFSAARITRIGHQLLLILSSLGRDSGRALGNLDWIPEEECRLVVGYEGVLAQPVQRTIPSLVSYQSGDKIALRDSRASYSYRALRQRVDHLCPVIVAAVPRGARIGVLGRRSAASVIALLAVMEAGDCYVPLDSANPPERLALMLEDGHLDALLVADGDSLRLAQELTAGYPQSSAPVIISWQPGEGSALVGDGATLVPSPVAPTAPAYMIFTSGSTGRPKGVVVSHSAFCTMIREQIKAFDIHADDSCGQFATLAFDASISEIFLALGAGATLEVAPDEARESTEVFRDWLRERQLTVLTLSPAFLRLLDVSELSGLRVLITAGEAADTAQAAALAVRMKVINAYGPTEAAVCATCFQVHPGGDWPFGLPIGSPLPGVLASVRDAIGQRCPIGVPGELYLAGPTLADGYAFAPELTAAKFPLLPETPAADSQCRRWYRTGDRCRWREDGVLEYQGRCDSQVKIRGFRLELGEVEQTLGQVSGITAAVAIVDKRWGLVAFCQCPTPVAEEELRSAASRRLPSYMQPSRYVILPEFPRTASAKIDRRRLIVPELSVVGEDEAPQGEAETVLAAVWSEVLGHSSLGRNANFFNLGGDSLKVLRVISALREKGWSATLKGLFASPVLSEAASLLTRNDVGGEPERMPAAEKDEPQCGIVPLLPIQRWFFQSRQIRTARQFALSVVLKSASRLDLGRLQDAVDKLLAKHDMLRARFFRQAGVWQMDLRESLSSLSCLSAMTLANDGQESDWEKLGRTLGRPFDLENEPLLRLCLIHTGAGDFLAVVVHHLVVDWVSLRILMEDLGHFYEHRPVPGGTHLAVAWARLRAQETDRSSWAVGKELQRLVRASAFPAAGCHGELVTRAASFPLQGRPFSREVLLGGIIAASKAGFHLASIPVVLEGHGRTQTVAGRPLDRSIGWFTRLDPLILDTGTPAAIRTALASVPREGRDLFAWLADSPARCRRDFPAFLSFNFLGDLTTRAEQGGTARPLFTLSERTLPGMTAPETPAGVPLQIEAFILHDTLHLQMAWCPRAIPAETMERWWKRVAEAVSR